MRSLAALLFALLAVALARPAIADTLLVLQSEGRVDAATRAEIDAAILKLALAAGQQASPGSLTLTDAALAVGCKPDTMLCQDEVLSMLGVDEMVITTAAPKPGGIEINVRRTMRGGTSRQATMLLPTDTPPDQLTGIAPLFEPLGAHAGAATGSRAPPPDGSVAPAPAVPHEPAPPRVATVASPDRALPPWRDPQSSRRRMEVIGMIGGACLITSGMLLWGAAQGVQNDINDAVTNNPEDFDRLRDLESRGDTYAGLGNLFVISGLVVGGVATYFYIKDSRATSSVAARLTPAVLDRGVGLVLTIGGPR